MKNFAKGLIAVIIFRPFFFILSSAPVWSYLNREARKSHKRTDQLNEAQTKVANDLKQNGIAMTSLDELFPGKNLLPTLRQYAENLRSSGVVSPGKPFLTALFPDDMELNNNNPFVNLSLDKKVVDVIGEYLGVSPKFFYLSLNITNPMPAGSTAIRSQNWHRDPEDKKMCKMFVYLTDVDENSGPFIYVRDTHNDGKFASFYPQKPPKGAYPPDEAVEKGIPAKNTLVCTARAGAVIFGDTAGLHRGGFAKTKERLMFTAEFASAASLRPVRYKLSSNFVSQVLPGLPESVRFALTPERRVIARWLNSVSDFALKYGLY